MNLWNYFDKIKNLKWVDLTHGFDENTPRWPGFAPLTKDIKLDFDQYPVRAHVYSFPGQYGTHIDAPAHAKEGGTTLDQIPIKDFMMKLCVIDCHQQVEKNCDYALTIKDVYNYEKKYGQIPEGAFVAMRSDWSKRWPDQSAYLNEDENGICHYPGWSLDAVKFLLEQRKVASFGHETFDTDPPALVSQQFFKAECHILQSGHFQIEVMNHLDQVPASGAILFCTFPKQLNGTGFPARCFAICPK